MVNPWLSWGRVCDCRCWPVHLIKVNHLGTIVSIEHPPQHRGSRLEMQGTPDSFSCQVDPHTSGSSSSASSEASISISAVMWKDIPISLALWAARPAL
jgi:hypothetical protein